MPIGFGSGWEKRCQKDARHFVSVLELGSTKAIQREELENPRKARNGSSPFVVFVPFVVAQQRGFEQEEAELAEGFGIGGRCFSFRVNSRVFVAFAFWNWDQPKPFNAKGGANDSVAAQLSYLGLASLSQGNHRQPARPAKGCRGRRCGSTPEAVGIGGGLTKQATNQSITYAAMAATFDRDSNALLRVRDVSRSFTVARAVECPASTMISKGPKPRSTLYEWPFRKRHTPADVAGRVPFLSVPLLQ